MISIYTQRHHVLLLLIWHTLTRVTFFPALNSCLNNELQYVSLDLILACWKQRNNRLVILL